MFLFETVRKGKVSSRRAWRTKALAFGLLAVWAAGLLTVWHTVPTSANASVAAANRVVAANASEGAVYVIPVKQTVASGLASFLDRALTEAEEAKASLVVLDVDTPGGEIGSAETIGERIRTAKVSTVAFVSGKAASAGAYVALNADEIVMAPATSIGAAMIVDAEGRAVQNPKFVSLWSQEMASAAELNGRNPAIAAGMVDPDRVVELKELGRSKEKGQIISLTAQDAMKVGYAEKIIDSVEETIAWKGLSDRAVVDLKPSFAEKTAAFVTSGGIATLLLVLGIAGIAIELLVPGFGAPGIVGLLSFGLYFFGHFIAGFAGMESIALFALGLVLLVAEMFVPSFGVLGVLGSAAVIAGIAMAAYDKEDAIRSLGWAALVAVCIVGVFAYIFRRRGVWNRFILRDSLTTEEGYVPNAPRESWLGKTGTALSALRPAGVADIGGERVDVVTWGEFVEKGADIVVTAVDGTRIVVKKNG